MLCMSMHEGEATYINCLVGPHADGSNGTALSDSELMVRMKIHEIAKALRACVPGFENAYVSWSAIQSGVRASKVTKCEKEKRASEISDGARFEDEIGLFGFQDLLPRDPALAIGGRGFYGLPYRMLLPLDSENLFMAGRCVTTQLEAHMSTRNVVSCMIQGQAAGIAAALCARKYLKPRQLPYAILKQELLRQKVILDL